jgi:hypothetical protein
LTRSAAQIYLCAVRKNMRTKQVRTVAAVLWLGAMSGLCAEPLQDPGGVLGDPADLSAWAYAYRADYPQ